jgi:hypothetical protein
VVTDRCTYCHGGKHSLDLSNDSSIEEYSGPIAELVLSDIRSERHMPPGKKLPAAELELIRGWAESR